MQDPGRKQTSGTAATERPAETTLPDAALAAPENLDDFAFVRRTHVDDATIARARLIATGWNVPPHEVMLALGWISVTDYVCCLAAALGVETAFAATPDAPPLSANGSQLPPRTALINATEATPDAVAARTDAALADGLGVCLTSDLRPDLTDTGIERRQRVRRATHALRKSSPAASAASAPPLWLLAAVISVIGAFVGTALVDTPLAYFIITCVAAIPFALIVALRILVLLVHLVSPQPRLTVPADRLAMADLPVYTVLVPLYDEAEILPDLVDALIRIDYPAAKLDVILVLEEADLATRHAAAAGGLPGFIRVVTVPPSGPRTKPKALNYALEFARGAFVTVYDAEDIPEPGQLRKAVAVFDAHPDVVCLQARLNIYNRADGWLARQFALEYTALFDGLLPALERLRLPIPLGGTSNHFRLATLSGIGAWDPFNVTEDADLGMRLARRAGRIAILPSTTWEEAPATWRDWLPQRTRWLKGWMQTYMVHMRRPLALWADLGTLPFLGFQCVIFGFLFSALLHPFFYVLVALELTRATPFAHGPGLIEHAFWQLALFNLSAGYVSVVALAALTALRRGWPGLALSVLWMPAYWLLASFAAYRALWQLFAAPHHWEKTPHHARTHAPPVG